MKNEFLQRVIRLSSCLIFTMAFFVSPVFSMDRRFEPSDQYSSTSTRKKSILKLKGSREVHPTFQKDEGPIDTASMNRSEHNSEAEPMDLPSQQEQLDEWRRVYAGTDEPFSVWTPLPLIYDQILPHLFAYVKAAVHNDEEKLKCLKAIESEAEEVFGYQELGLQYLTQLHLRLAWLIIPATSYETVSYHVDRFCTTEGHVLTPSRNLERAIRNEGSSTSRCLFGLEDKQRPALPVAFILARDGLVSLPCFQEAFLGGEFPMGVAALSTLSKVDGEGPHMGTIEHPIDLLGHDLEHVSEAMELLYGCGKDSKLLVVRNQLQFLNTIQIKECLQKHVSLYSLVVSHEEIGAMKKTEAEDARKVVKSFAQQVYSSIKHHFIRSVVTSITAELNHIPQNIRVRFKLAEWSEQEDGSMKVAVDIFKWNTSLHDQLKEQKDVCDGHVKLFFKDRIEAGETDQNILERIVFLSETREEAVELDPTTIHKSRSAGDVFDDVFNTFLGDYGKLLNDLYEEEIYEVGPSNSPAELVRRGLHIVRGMKQFLNELREGLFDR